MWRLPEDAHVLGDTASGPRQSPHPAVPWALAAAHSHPYPFLCPQLYVFSAVSRMGLEATVGECSRPGCSPSRAPAFVHTARLCDKYVGWQSSPRPSGGRLGSLLGGARPCAVRSSMGACGPLVRPEPLGSWGVWEAALPAGPLRSWQYQEPTPVRDQDPADSARPGDRRARPAASSQLASVTSAPEPMCHRRGLCHFPQRHCGLG